MSMIESCVVLYLSYLTEDRLLPEYLFAPFIFLQRLCCPGQYKARLEREAKTSPEDESAAGVIFRRVRRYEQRVLSTPAPPPDPPPSPPLEGSDEANVEIDVGPHSPRRERRKSAIELATEGYTQAAYGRSGKRRHRRNNQERMELAKRGAMADEEVRSADAASTTSFAPVPEIRAASGGRRPSTKPRRASVALYEKRWEQLVGEKKSFTRGGDSAAVPSSAAAAAAEAMAEVDDDDEEEESEEKKLIFYESIFFEADENMRGYLTLEEVQQRSRTAATTNAPHTEPSSHPHPQIHPQVSAIFSFLDLDRNAAERCAVIEQVNTAGTGKLVRLAFVELCVELIWNQPLDEIEKAFDNFKSAQSMFSRRNSEKWKQLGRDIDSVCKVVLPFSFLSILVWFFCIDFRDDYDVDHRTTERGLTPFNGILDIVWNSTGPIFILPIIMVVFIAFQLIRSVFFGDLCDPSVQELRNRAAVTARSRDPSWLAHIVDSTSSPPEMHRFASSASVIKPKIAKGGGVAATPVSVQATAGGWC